MFTWEQISCAILDLKVVMVCRIYGDEFLSGLSLEVTYEGHPNCSKAYIMNILEIFGDHILLWNWPLMCEPSNVKL